MLDFTIKKYSQMLKALINRGYHVITFEDYCNQKNSLELNEKYVVLRHDVDLKAGNSLVIAKVEQSIGIKATYYFRIVEQSNKPEIIKSIAAMGHEIGYHYEDMTICEGDIRKAISHFEKWLSYFRQYYPVKTICMHGSPRSGFDGRDLWKKYDYHDYGIIGEPYFDVDFSKFFYLTDTGRRWDGYTVSVRDKIPMYQEIWSSKGWTYHGTDEIIEAIDNKVFPKQLMMTTHPQRWTDDFFSWGIELTMQSAKNVVKKWVIKKNDRK